MVVFTNTGKWRRYIISRGRLRGSRVTGGYFQEDTESGVAVKREIWKNGIQK